MNAKKTTTAMKMLIVRTQREATLVNVGKVSLAMVEIARVSDKGAMFLM